jgi:hypothetical protein
MTKTEFHNITFNAAEITSAYLSPGTEKHIDRNNQFILPDNLKLVVHHDQDRVTLNWKDSEQRKKQFESFLKVSTLVVTSLISYPDEESNDKKFAEVHVPKIFEILKQSTLFELLKDKHSETQEDSIINHLEIVPKALDTRNCTLLERYSVRMGAIFHDISKAFDTGKDQLHYHPWLSSVIYLDFATDPEYQKQIIEIIITVQAGINPNNKIFLESETDDENINFPPGEEIITEYLESVRQTSEIIRLHHLFEQLDKGNLTMDSVVTLFSELKINLDLLLILLIADGGSVIHNKAQYASFLIANIEQAAKLSKLLEQDSDDDSESSSMEKYIHILKYVLDLLLDVLNNITDAMKKEIESIFKVFSETLASHFIDILATKN